MRVVYGIVTAFVLVLVDLLVSLLAAAIQQQAFGDQFSSQSIFWLMGLIVIGVLAGYWLGGRVTVPAPAPTQPATPARSSPSHAANTVSITRLRALLSYGELKGRGVHLSDILLIGSVLKIDSDSSQKD